MILKSQSLLLSEVVQSKIHQNLPPIINRMIYFLQFFFRFSWLFPGKTWVQWQYEQDRQLNYMGTLFQQFNLKILLDYAKSDSLVLLLAVGFIFVHVSAVVILNVYGKIRKQKPSSTLFKFLYHYFVLLKTILCIPTTILIAYLLNQTNFELYIVLPVVTLGCLILSINSFITIIFLRKFQFGNQQQLIPQFSYIQFCVLITETSLIFIQHLSLTQMNVYIQIILNLVMWLILLRQEIVLQTQYPNHFCCLFLNSTGLVVSGCILISILADGFFGQENLVIFTMIAITFIFPIIVKYDENREQKILSLRFDSLSADEHQIVQCVEQLYLTHQRTKTYQNPYYRVKLVHLYQIHRQFCDQEGCQLVFKSLFNDSQRLLSKGLLNFVVTCVFQTSLSQRTNKLTIAHYLSIIYISFLQRQCNNPLNGYMELKHYQYQGDYYLRFLYECLDTNISQELIRIQQEKVIQNTNQNDEKTIQIKDVNFCQGLEWKYVPIIVDIMNNRMKIWENLIKGHKEIKEFKDQLIQLGILIHKCRDSIQKDIKLNLEDNSNWQQKAQNSIFELKILVMYYASVMNDQLSAFRGSQFIEEVLRFESMVNSDKILNLTLLQDKVILVQISLHKQRGVILNTERNSLAIFFGFQNELEFQHIKHLNQLLPDVFSKEHDSFLEHYLGEGKSSLFNSQKQVFINNSKRFSETVNLGIDNFFEIRDDYVLTGSLVKVRQTSQYIYFDQTGLINGISEELFQQIQSATQIDISSLTQTGYIYFLIPQLFEIIEMEKEDLIKNKLDQRQVERQICFIIGPGLLNILKKFQESTIIQKFEKQDKSRKKQSRHYERFSSSYTQISQRTTKSQKIKEDFSQINQSKIDGWHIQLLDHEYRTEIEDFMKLIHSDLEAFDAVEFQCRMILTLNLFGYKQCKSSFFQLECLEVKRNTMTQSGTSQHFFKVQSTIVDKMNDLILKTQIYSPESPSSLKSNQVQNLIVSELSAKASGFRSFNEDMLNPITLNQQKIQGIELETRNFHPQFRLPQINREDDYEMIDFENDFKEIKILSPRGNENQEIQFLQQVEAEDVGMDRQKSNSLAQKGQSNSQNIVKLFKKKKNTEQAQDQIDQMQASRGSSKTSYSNNMGLALVQTLQRRKGIISPITSLTRLNLLLFIVFFTILIINLQMAKQSIVSYSDAANRVIAPVQLNSYYCEVLTLSWILLYQRLGIYEYSEYMNKRFILSSQTISENIYKDFDHMAKILQQSEQDKLVSLVKIYLVTGQELQDVGITYFRDLTLSRFSSLISFFLDPDQKLTQNEIEDILFLKDNFVQAQFISQNLIISLNDQQLQLLDSNQSEMTMTISIEIIILSLLISTQITFWFQLKKYQEKILLILTRVYEKDAQVVQTRIAVTRDILLRKTIQVWKQCDFYQLWFYQPSKKNLANIGASNKYAQMIQQNIQADIVNTKQLKHKRLARTYLTSRVGNLLLPIQVPMIILSVFCILITVYLVVSLIIYQQQQIQIYPAQQVCTNIFLFVQRLDALICASLIVKTKVLVYDAIDTQFELPEKFKINPYQGGEFFYAFENLFQGYSQQVADIQLTVYSMDQMIPEDRLQIQFLFEKKFCEYLYDQLIFCSYKENEKADFIKKHGQFTEQENNYLFISQGMAAVNTQYQTLTRIQFDKELKTKQHIQDKQEILQNLQTQQFTNAYPLYFLDTRKAYNLFMNKVIEAMKRMMDSYITEMAIYYTLAWVSIATISAFIAIRILRISYRETEMLHLSLSNLPYELLNEKQTMTLLKGL